MSGAKFLWDDGRPGVRITRLPMGPARRRGPRGVQAEEGAQAADALLAQGLKLTIERMRQALGDGSPNTISPLLDQWFSGLASRVAGVPATDTNDWPSNLRSAWNHAKHEARCLAQEEPSGARAELEKGRAQLSTEQAALRARRSFSRRRKRSTRGRKRGRRPMRCVPSCWRPRTN